MAEGNGHSRKLPKINISDDAPDKDQMLNDIWAQVQMTNLKLYGDKDKRIIGITDEIVALNTKIDTFIAEVKPLLEDRRFRKRIVKGLAWLVAGIGLKELSEYILTHYLK